MENQTSSVFKILLVEDDEITNYITTTKLRNIGFENVDAVLNGELALEYLAKDQPNLIFLDVNMPVMDGFEFLDSTEVQNEYSDIPIVLLTSSSRPKDKEMASRYSNVIEYLEKPLNYEKMKKILLAINK
ncbi:response regulator [Cellulophaga baltica]|uniref:response regulator n=1 Tax=Cellulophaga TaxID=104264 RepID=UPI00051D58C5|nr:MULTISPECIES: response regulator [Cellulophaga]KGK28787.1 histidine kinase [Cellulophaga sp. E6(2014)]MCR1026931.1 response regulator [Cellulophaga baltica]